MGETRNACRIPVGRLEGKRPSKDLGVDRNIRMKVRDN
jgi:hypothetical protein